MCRILGYLGSPILLDYVLSKPEHSLIVQSYQPQKMTSGVVNADGFGVGWYHPQQDVEPFIYRNTLPIWSDINLEQLSRYIESGCIVANIRSATTGQAVDLSNCQPFIDDRLMFTHNGFIERFRQSLYRPIRSRLSDRLYQKIDGMTDSEHIFALFLNYLESHPSASLAEALRQTLEELIELSQSYNADISANLLVTDGHQMVASRFATRGSVPSLYWLRDDPAYPDAVMIASEPLFAGNWHCVPESSIVSVGENLEIHVESLSG